MAIAAGSMKLRMFLAVGDEGEPREVGTVTVPLRATEDSPGVITIHATETVEAVESALRGLTEALHGRP